MAALWVLALLTLAVAGWVGAKDVRGWLALSDDKAATATLQSRLDRAIAVRAALAASAAAPPSYAIDARRWMALSTFDTAGVLRSVESAQIAGAKVVALDIDAPGRSVELEVEVASAEVATAYLQALNAGIDHPVWVISRLQAQAGIESALILGQIP